MATHFVSFWQVSEPYYYNRKIPYFYYFFSRNRYILVTCQNDTLLCDFCIVLATFSSFFLEKSQFLPKRYNLTCQNDTPNTSKNPHSCQNDTPFFAILVYRFGKNGGFSASQVYRFGNFLWYGVSFWQLILYRFGNFPRRISSTSHQNCAQR